MPPIPRPFLVRTAEANQRLQSRGGAAALPSIISSHDIVPLFGRSYFMELLRNGHLPGIQVVPGGVWRCQRETFLEWLEAGHQ